MGEEKLLMPEEEQAALGKLEQLKKDLQERGKVAVAFSGGVDSTLLLAVAAEVLGENCIAVSAMSASFPVRESEEAKQFCRERGIRRITFSSREIDVPGYRENPPDRCYLCKKALFGTMLEIAAENGMAFVAEGSNMDDEGDYRPGLIAIRELGVLSPLRKAGLSKREIRYLSKVYDLPTWKKPSFACLATRFVYGEPITEEKLAMVGRAEEFLKSLGFEQLRVRIHGTMARIEVEPERIPEAVQHRKQIADALHGYGFSYVSIDLDGYRTGSMNEQLPSSLLKEVQEKGAIG